MAVKSAGQSQSLLKMAYTVAPNVLTLNHGQDSESQSVQQTQRLSEHDPTFAEFGQGGELITGTTAVCVATHAKGRADYLPSELEKLHGKKFIVTVTPSEQSLEADFFYFKVQATEHLENEAPLAYYQ